jgi:hypothetical protein
MGALYLRGFCAVAAVRRRSLGVAQCGYKNVHTRNERRRLGGTPGRFA